MSEPSNPYESPQLSNRAAAHPAIKAGISSLTILVLMPVAMTVAFCIGCGIGVASVDALFGRNYDAMILFAIVLSWGPPIGVMIAMLIWRGKVRRRELAAVARVESHDYSAS